MDFLSLWRVVGWTVVPLLALSIFAFALIIERWLAFRGLGASDATSSTRCIELGRESRFDEALQLCEQSRGAASACLATVLRNRNQSKNRIESLVEETGQSYFLRLEKNLHWLDTATTIAPLLGLLGTISGMIGAFRAIASRAQNAAQVNNDAVLGGVAEALYATALGIAVAVVCFIAYNAFAARLRALTGETELAVTQLQNVLHEAQETAKASDIEKPNIEYSMSARNGAGESKIEAENASKDVSENRREVEPKVEARRAV